MSEQNSDATSIAGDVPEIKINPAVLDRYVGWYRIGEYGTIAIARDGDKLFTERTGDPRHELVAQSDTEFFVPATNAYGHFEVDAQGHATELVLYQQGSRIIAPRIDAAVAEEMKSKLAAKIAAQTPSPNSEAALRRLVESIHAGEPIYGEMSASIAEVIRQQFPLLQATAKYLGAIKSLEFLGVGNRGFDVFNVHCEHGESQWRIDVRANGVIDGGMTLSSSIGALRSLAVNHDGENSDLNAEHTEVSREVLRRMIVGIRDGAPNYNEMTPLIAYAIKQQMPQLQAMATRFGDLVDIEHVSSDLQRFDVFDIKRERGTTRMRISVNGDGAITSAMSVVTGSALTGGP